MVSLAQQRSQRGTQLLQWPHEFVICYLAGRGMKRADRGSVSCRTVLIIKVAVTAVQGDISDVREERVGAESDDLHKKAT